MIERSSGIIFPIMRSNKRLPLFHFDLPIHEIRRGYRSDVYFWRSKVVLEKTGNRKRGLIQAFQNLNSSLPEGRDLKLVIAGGSSATPEYAQRLHDMAGDNPDVIFTGFVTGVEKEEFFSNALIFSLPSSLEGFPIVLLEAKSYGICCLASDIPPHCELFKPGVDGILVKSDSQVDLSSKLQMLIRKPHFAAEIGIRAKESLQQIPDWREVAERTLEIYRDIC